MELEKSPRIAIVIGTRAELIKTFPVMLELQKRKVPYYFIHTGQHSLKDLCEKFGVKRPNSVLTSAPKKSSKFYSKINKAIFWNLSLMFKVKKELKKLKKLKWVLYHGDTMTTASAAIGSSKLFNPFKKYRNIHLEAGLRSNNLFEPFPEEISRIIADNFSDTLLAVSSLSEDNLKKMKKKKKIFVTGNTIIDSANFALSLSKNYKIKPLSKKKFALVSIHRHENIKNEERLKRIVKILLALEIPTYFTMHDNTKKQLIKFGLYDKLKQNKNIKIIETLDYPSFVYQIKNCSLILCDGGSMQEESLIFEKPCIVLRKATERQEGLQTNFQFLSDLNVEKTKEKIKEYLSPIFKVQKFKNPYGEVGLTKKIVDLLTK